MITLLNGFGLRILTQAEAFFELKEIVPKRPRV